MRSIIRPLCRPVCADPVSSRVPLYFANCVYGVGCVSGFTGAFAVHSTEAHSLSLSLILTFTPAAFAVESVDAKVYELGFKQAAGVFF